MMENITEKNSRQTNYTSDMPAASLGKMLREARERLGLSVADVASQIKFAPRQIEALEAEDFRNLPEAAFLRGFVRSYAKILHLDPQALFATLPQNKAASAELTPESVGEPFPNVHTTLKQNVIWLSAALLVALVALVFLLWHFATPEAQPKAEQVETPLALPSEIQIKPDQIASEVAATGPVTPVPRKRSSATAGQSSAQATSTIATRLEQQKQKPEKTSDTQPAFQSGDAQPDAQPDTSSPITSLRLVFREESWAEIKDKNGKILSSRLHAPGTEMRVNGRAPFSLQIGNASSVSLYHQGSEVDLTPYINDRSRLARFTLN
ncbi:MAG: DUF4115 domain-containing protein [Gallionella sp.]|nr:DUF4115 domain-containing protein [Gallionella sp.]